MGFFCEWVVLITGSVGSIGAGHSQMCMWHIALPISISLLPSLIFLSEKSSSNKMVKHFSSQGHADDLDDLSRIWANHGFTSCALKPSPFKGIVHPVFSTFHGMSMVALVGLTFSNPDNPSRASQRERVTHSVNVKWAYVSHILKHIRTHLLSGKGSCPICLKMELLTPCF